MEPKLYGTAVIVIGMHRSGTSMVAGSLSRVGVDLSPHLLPPKEDNPKGFYEHIDIQTANVEILRSLGSDYDDVNPLPENWHRLPHLLPLKERIKEVLLRDFKDSPLFGFKDPRISILLPLYFDIIEELSLKACFVVCRRPPHEIAESLRKRNRFWYTKSFLLHQKYAKAIKKGMSKRSFVEVEMSSFIKHPEAELQKIAETLQLPLVLSDKNLEEVRNFIAKDLKHHSLSPHEFLVKVTSELDAKDQRYYDAEEKNLLIQEEKKALDLNFSALKDEYAHIKNVLEERDASIRSLNEELKNEKLEKAERLKEISSENTSNKAMQESQIAQLESQVVQLQEEIISLNHTLAHRDHRVQFLEEENSGLQKLESSYQTLQAIEKSYSWKILHKMQRIADTFFTADSSYGKWYRRKIVSSQNQRVRQKINSSSQTIRAFPDTTDILFINHEESRTGAPRILFEVASAAQENYSILIASKSRGSMSKEFREEFGEKHLYPTELSLERERHALAKEMLEKIRPKAVYVNSIVSYEYAYEARKLGIPALFHVHELGNAYDIAIEKEHHAEFQNSAPLFIAVSEATKHHLEKRMNVKPETIELIHEFIDSEKIKDLANEILQPEINERLGVKPKDIIVLSVGTFDQRKGGDIFLKTAERVRKTHSHIRFVWIGREPKANEPLFTLFKNSRKYFIHIPETENPFPYFKRADIFFLSSREDPFPLVVLEAMALGKPIVAFSKSGGVEEAAGGCGLFLEKMNANRAAETIVELALDEAKRKQLGQNAAVQQKAYDQKVILPKIIDQIQKILS